MRSSSSTSSSSAGKKRKLKTPLLSLGINEKITLKFGDFQRSGSAAYGSASGGDSLREGE